MKQLDLRSFLNDPSSLPRATTLLQESGLRTVLFHLKDGEQLPEHNVPGPISILCLTGQCTLVAGLEQIRISRNVVASLAGRISHSVVAHEETLLLVTIADAMPIRPS